MRIQFDGVHARLAKRAGSSGEGVECALSSKAFDVLRLLVEGRPNVIDKASLHARIWPRTFVVDANLTVLIAELRRALADRAREPRFIRTVHAHGYVFCGEALDLARRRSRWPPRHGAG